MLLPSVMQEVVAKISCSFVQFFIFSVPIFHRISAVFSITYIQSPYFCIMDTNTPNKKYGFLDSEKLYPSSIGQLAAELLAFRMLPIVIEHPVHSIDKATNNHTGFENILNIWSGPGPGGFGRTRPRPRCFHGPGRSLVNMLVG